MTAEARPHRDTDRDVVVSVQDGNYRMVEVARVTPPADAGPARSVTVVFDCKAPTGRHQPASIRVDYAAPEDPRP